MYPNLYYIFKDLFGVEWRGLSFLNTFGLLVAIAFLIAARILSIELKRKERAGLLLPREEMITIGSPASIIDLLSNGLMGFVFGYKLIGLFFFKPDYLNAQEFIFSKEGNFAGGFVLGLILAGLKWYEKNKQKLKQPERRIVRIRPHDRVGDIIVLGLVFGILGSKLFDNLEHWDDFVQHPVESILSPGGLTFYGGLILATIAILWYANKKEITIKHLVDAAAPVLMIAYAVGRLGCQLSGDGDWGIYNSAYVNDNAGKIVLAGKHDFDSALNKNASYFLEGKVTENFQKLYVTDRVYSSLNEVPHYALKGPNFLPVWLFAYSYPQNVNKDGILIPGNAEEHNRMLPIPVFPTPLYETIICTFLFLILWLKRKKIKAPYFMFGLYLLLNGAERLLIECMRVNRPYSILGIRSTQAQFIAVLLMIVGTVMMWLAHEKYKKTILQNIEP